MITMVMYSIQQCNDKGFVLQFPMPIICSGPHSLAKGNYLQDVLADLVVLELVALLLRAFSTALSSGVVSSNKGV